MNRLTTLKTITIAAALSIAANAFGQGATPQTPPATTQKPAAPSAPPAAAPAPPKPFPEGAKIAYISVRQIFAASAEGKAMAGRIEAWEKQKRGEIDAKAKQAQALQTALGQGGSVLNDAARARNEKELQRLQREIQAMQEDAQQEAQGMQQQMLQEFSRKVNPLVEQIATEKSLYMVIAADQVPAIAWADRGLDLSAEVIKRLDAATKAAPKK